jgi:hypothetical protein
MIDPFGEFDLPILSHITDYNGNLLNIPSEVLSRGTQSILAYLRDQSSAEE